MIGNAVEAGENAEILPDLEIGRELRVGGAEVGALQDFDAVFGEILACPSIQQIEGLGVCLLDCDDGERITRVRHRGGTATMEMLTWSAWLRVHAKEPEWYPEVITKQGYSRMEWQNWQTHCTQKWFP